MKNLKQGDKIICINPTGYLVKGEIYTVGMLVDCVNGVSIRVDECDDKEGFTGYQESRFIKLNQTLDVNFIDLSDVFYAAEQWCQAIGDTKTQAILDRLADSFDNQVFNN